ncbi:MAG: hypothetical protein M3208_02995, partial [Thermoproteota archaeon]|nr:hypothetical protein [Thermoproteota archaeon]
HESLRNRVAGTSRFILSFALFFFLFKRKKRPAPLTGLGDPRAAKNARTSSQIYLFIAWQL